MIIDGKKIAGEMLEQIAGEVEKFKKPPRLAAVLAGDNGGSRKFLELKKKAAEKIGIECRIYEFPENITTQKLRRELVGIAKARVNHGVILELPLPPHINMQYALNAIPPEKDMDVLSEKSQGAFFAGRSAVLPPSVEAIRQILLYNDISLRGKISVVFGYGLLVGKPISHWLASQGATVSIINEFTLNAERYTLNADVVISGVGKPNLITADMVKEGAVVVDFGYNVALDAGNEANPASEAGQSPEHFAKQNVVGDVDFEGVSKKAGLITPVPGGVGPIVIAAVLKNIVALAKTQTR